MNGYKQEPIVRNAVIANDAPGAPFATTNTNKQKEIQRIIGGSPQFIDPVPVYEIQSRDPEIVARQKAIAAWRAHNFTPVIIEDVSLTIPALEHLLPGPYVNDWGKTLESRKQICSMLDSDRRVIAETWYAVYDGKETHIRQGKTTGTIAEKPTGTNGFGWDDIFIPDGAKHTFAEMSDPKKDSYSMRKKALLLLKRDPFPIGTYIFQMQEPFADELARVRVSELIDDKPALSFAYALEVLGNQKPNKELRADTYVPIHKKDVRDNGAIYYTQYTTDPNSPSLGLLLTSISRARIKLVHGDEGEPVMYQMGPIQRKIAIAQRVNYFKDNQNADIHARLDDFESGKKTIPKRANRNHNAVDVSLKFENDHAVQTPALEQIGYRKQSSIQKVSRKIKEVDYLVNKIGKHYRRIILGGSMPPASGGRDALVTAAIGHMATFVPRNSIFAAHIERQVALVKNAYMLIDALAIPKKWKTRAKQNIGASLGIDNPKTVIQEARKLYNAGVRLFRIYTIGADPRLIETARVLRKTFGDEIELFAGQIADKKQAEQLIAKDIRIDALIFGHGGGRQCTSAQNGMGVTTLEEAYEIIRDPMFNDTTILLEGGVGRNIGAMLILGIDGVLYNQRIMHGCIESPAGDIFFVKKDSDELVQPYPGSASAETQLIESIDPIIRLKRTNIAGRISTEGSSGFMYFERKSAGSMVFWIDSLLHDASRMLADLGVKNLGEMRTLIQDEKQEFLRIVTPEARYKGSAYGKGK